MSRNKIGIAVTSVAAAAVLGFGGAALANAATDNSTSSSSSTSQGQSGQQGQSRQQGQSGQQGQPGRQGRPGQQGGRGASQDTPVTGSEADKVIAAVKAKDAAVSIDTVRMDPDGSYDALGTKGGSPVFFDVSKDLGTITENTMAGPNGQAPNGQAPNLPAPNGQAPNGAPSAPTVAPSASA